MGGSGGKSVAMNVLDSLLVPEQDKDHGATGIHHEAQTQKVGEIMQYSNNTQLYITSLISLPLSIDRVHNCFPH